MSEVITTPDLRYIVVRGRLWRRANPGLSAEHRASLVSRLMDGRRAVKAAEAAEHEGRPEAGTEMKAARAEVDAAKTELGERGPVWWDDGAPDLNRHMVRNTPYASWFAALNGGEPGPK